METLKGTCVYPLLYEQRNRFSLVFYFKINLSYRWFVESVGVTHASINTLLLNETITRYNDSDCVLYNLFVHFGFALY